MSDTATIDDREQRERDELFAMAQRAMIPPTPAPRPAPPPVDPRSLVQRNWSQLELDNWLQAALKVERERIRQLSVKALTSSQSKQNDFIFNQLNKIVESLHSNADTMHGEVQTIVDKIQKTFDQQNETIKTLQAEVVALKTRKGWFKK